MSRCNSFASSSLSLSLLAVLFVLLLSLARVDAAVTTADDNNGKRESRFTPKYMHIPQIRAYYKHLLANEDRILEQVPDFFDVLDIPTSWAATQLCSAVFVSGIEEQKAIVEDVSIARFVTKMTVDYEEKSVTATLIAFGIADKAIYREGVGCILVDGLSEEELRSQDLGDQTPLPPLNDSLAWPLGEYVDGVIPDGVDMKCLDKVSNQDFRNIWRNTRAFLVVYKDKIIYERYADGIHQNSKLIGWSMTKSVTSSIIGILTGQGLLNIDDPAPVWEWAGDSRSNITVRDMLHMGSGIRYNELQIVFCLWTSDGDCAHYFASLPQRSEPSSSFVYSSANTVLLARIAAENRGDRDTKTNFEYWRSHLYSKIQMHNSVVESQAIDGIPIGGSLMWASARDWARFGYLYMKDGVWADGTRVLPEGWASFSCAPGTTGDFYGAQWWLSNVSGHHMCRADGFRGQNVFNVFDKQLTVVRLAMPGLLTQTISWNSHEFMEEVLACFD